MDTSLSANKIRQMFMDFFMDKYEVSEDGFFSRG
jgi:hypothetical protein